jgi:hypothetical protein
MAASCDRYRQRAGGGTAAAWSGFQLEPWLSQTSGPSTPGSHPQLRSFTAQQSTTHNTPQEVHRREQSLPLKPAGRLSIVGTSPARPQNLPASAAAHNIPSGTQRAAPHVETCTAAGRAAQLKPAQGDITPLWNPGAWGAGTRHWRWNRLPPRCP